MTGRISELTELTAIANDDEFEIMDQSGTPNNDSRNMRIKRRNILKGVVNTYTSNQTLTTDNEVVLLNPSTTAMTITLPAASGNTGVYYKLTYISTTGQPVIIDGNAAETINGKTTVLIEHQYSQWELYCDGSNWFGLFSNLNLPTETSYYLFEDFVGGSRTVGSNGGIGDFGWSGAGVGTETLAKIDGITNHVGIIRSGTGATNGDDNDLFLSGNTVTTENPFLSTDTFSMTFLIFITGTLANATRRYGAFLDTTSNNEEGTENACFLFDTAVSAKWRLRTRSSGGTDQTTTDGGADVALSTWYKLKIVKDGSTIRFYINNVNVANHATQIPTGALTPCITVDSTSASARSHDIDYFQMRLILAR